MDAFCFEVKPGEGRLATCLKQQLAEEEKPKYDGTRTSDGCKKALDTFLIARAGTLWRFVGVLIADSWVPSQWKNVH